MKKPTEIYEVKVIEVSPIRIPFKCVVCNGWTTVNHGAKKCEACDGRGYILIEAKETNSYTMPARTGGDFR